jgi:uncharacterized membrane protein YkvA (DUF1232 family)
MSDDARFLDVFSGWLKTLGDDVGHVGSLLRDDGLPEGARRSVAGAVNYLFKSLDLIPDGIEDLGFVDDAFVLRVAAAQALAAGSVDEGASSVTLGRYADEAKEVEAFLGAEYPRLETYVRGLAKGAARGRTVDEIIASAEVRDALLSEVSGWSGAYEAPAFTRDPKTLVKLRAFLDTKLPRLGLRYATVTRVATETVVPA